MTFRNGKLWLYPTGIQWHLQPSYSSFQLTVLVRCCWVTPPLNDPRILNCGQPLSAVMHTQADCRLPAQWEMVASQSNWVADEHGRNIQEAREPDVFLRSWRTKLGRKCQWILDFIQQVARKRAPTECPCCSVSSGCVSNVWQLFADTLALW